MCCSFGGLFCITDGYSVGLFFVCLFALFCFKKEAVQFQLLCEVQAMRCAILCKLLVILFLLRFIIKTASHSGSCYGDFQQE